MIAQRVRLIFSAYRRDDFADPDSFVMQLGMVLERYDDAVILHVSDPRTGIQRRTNFPPTIAEVVAACDAEATSIATRQRYAAMPRPLVRLTARPDVRPGRLANVFVQRGSRRYDEFVEKSKSSDSKWWRIDERGIWVPLGWFDLGAGPQPLKSEEIDRLYRRTAEERVTP